MSIQSKIDEVDERARFEEAGERLGIEKRYLTEVQWRLWKARAALERKS